MKVLVVTCSHELRRRTAGCLCGSILGVAKLADWLEPFAAVGTVLTFSICSKPCLTCGHSQPLESAQESSELPIDRHATECYTNARY